MGDFELGPVDPIVGMREFARLKGVDLRAIQKAIDAGRIYGDAVVLTKAGRKLRRELASAQWDASRLPGQNNRFGELDGDLDVQPDGQPEGLDKSDWFLIQAEEKAKLLSAQRQTAELELRKLEGSLLEVADVEKIWSGMILACRQRILSIPVKAAPRIAAMIVGLDIGAVETILREECDEALAELSESKSGEDEQADEDPENAEPTHTE